MFVGHASNLDTNTRLLMGRRALSKDEMGPMMHGVSYACFTQLEQNADGQWEMVPPCVYPVSHNKNPPYDWKRMAEFNPTTPLPPGAQ